MKRLLAGWRCGIPVLRYGLVSLAALAVDTGLLLLLVGDAHLQYLAAATLSFLLGAVLTHQLSVRYVFSYRRLQRPAAELGVFVAIGIVGLIVNDAVLALAVGVAAIPLLAAKLLAAIGSFSVNFLLRHRLLFRRPRIELASTQVIGSVAE